MMTSISRSSYGGVKSIITEANTEVVSGDFRYASSIDPISNLYAKWSYATGSPTRLPLVVLMHGYSGDADDLTPPMMNAIATEGLFALSVGMRGVNGAGGSKDSSGREIQDIIDAVEEAKDLFPGVIDPARVHIAGWSGGGANALAAACKFPDYFAVVAAHFPISDYGYHETFGWGAENSSYRPEVVSRIGAKAYASWPEAAPVNLNKYRARNAVEALPINRVGGHVYLFHDSGDTVTQVTQSNRVAAAMDDAGNSRYSLDVTTPSDAIRWRHDLPHPYGDPTGPPDGAPIRFARGVWGQVIREDQFPAWVIPASGEVRVLGYIVTKRFRIWLGDGTEHVASVVYDTTAGTYQVTPLTGTVTVSVQQGLLSAEATVSSATTLTVS